MRQEAQAELNASVKEVELAKFKLDQADLISPVNGLVADIGGLVVGLNVTPSSNPVKIVDNQSLRFRFVVDQEGLEVFLEPQKMRITYAKKDYSLTTTPPVMGKDAWFEIEANFDNSTGFLPGIKVQATLE